MGTLSLVLASTFVGTDMQRRLWIMWSMLSSDITQTCSMFSFKVLAFAWQNMSYSILCYKFSPILFEVKWKWDTSGSK